MKCTHPAWCGLTTSKEERIVIVMRHSPITCSSSILLQHPSLSVSNRPAWS